MFETAQKEDENYSLKFDKNLQLIQRKRGLPDHVVDEAVELTEGMMAAHRQHYDACHVAAASLHIACRRNNIPSTAKDFAKYLNEAEVLDERHEKPVYRAVKVLRKINDLEPKPLLAEGFLPLIKERADMRDETVDVAEDLLSRIQERTLAAGRSQIGMAAVAAYLAAKRCEDNPVDVEVFAEAASRDSSTLLGNARKIREELDLEKVTD